MRTHLEFRSSAFPAYKDEEEQINPGCYGRRLAVYVKTQLAEQGIPTQEIHPEDWGWVVPIINEGFDLWIGCGHRDGDPDEFLCFIEPSRPTIRRWLWKKIDTTAAVEAVNNVVYAYTDSGSRFRYGFELSSDRNKNAQYYFHFVGNRYLDSTGRETEINAAIDAGIESNIKAYFLDNIGPHRRSGDAQTALVFTGNDARDAIRSNAKAMRQVSATPLFTSTVPVTVQSADAAKDQVFNSAGCNLSRDATDTRIVADARANRPVKLRITQEGLAGGWSSYHP